MERLKRSRIKLPEDEYKFLCNTVVFPRDNWKCQIPGCGRKNNLHAHHVIFRKRQLAVVIQGKEIIQHGDDASWNLLTVCLRCHNAIHGTLDKTGIKLIVKPPENQLLDCDKKQYEIEFINCWRPNKYHDK